MNRRLETAVTVSLATTAIVVTTVFAHRTISTLSSVRETAETRELTRSDWNSVIASGSLLTSQDSSDVSIAVFSDFQCPACRRFFETTIEPLLARHPRSLRVLYLPLPISYHAEAMPAARATECLDGRVDGLLWHRVLYSKQDSLGAKPYSQFASEAFVHDFIGLDDCIEGAKAFVRIDSSLALSKRLRLTGTPSVIVDRILYSSPPSLDDLKAYIDRKRVR